MKCVAFRACQSSAPPTLTGARLFVVDETCIIERNLRERPGFLFWGSVLRLALGPRVYTGMFL